MMTARSCASLVDLARRLGLKTVAEWVQDEPSAQLLTEWGCDYLQGVLIGLASIERPGVTQCRSIAARLRALKSSRT